MKGVGDIADFLFEAGELKRVKRSGWWTAKIRDPESVAEHSFRTGLCAYLLALMEGDGEPEKTAVAALGHDLHEARTLDLHKVAAKYFDKHAGERRAKRHQGFEGALKLTRKQEIIVKDADLLEMALQAREYLDAGNAHARHWLSAARKGLKTAGGKRLYAQIAKSDSAKWWKAKGKRSDVIALARGMAPGTKATRKRRKTTARKGERTRGKQKLPYKYWRWGRLPIRRGK